MAKEETTKKATPLSRRLYRSQTRAVIAGVAAGLGEYFDIDPVIIRLLFIVIVFFGGFGIPLYIVLWILLPKKNTGDLGTEETMKSNIAEMRMQAETLGERIRSHKSNTSTRNFFAYATIAIGALILLDNLGMFRFNLYWPVILIILGLLLLVK
jgi:phage shock protein C